MCTCRDETGACYAIDIGGTNFRVVYYKLSDKRGVIVSNSSSRVLLHVRPSQPQQQQQCQTAATRSTILSVFLHSSSCSSVCTPAMASMWAPPVACRLARHLLCLLQCMLCCCL
jgi:hexokinase